MKTIKTIFAALIAIITVNVATATEAGNLKVNMESSSDDFTTVEILSSVVSQFEIQVTDSYGDEIYSMVTEAPAVMLNKKYDFSKLENGIYWHTVKIDKESTTNKFEVKNGKVKILEVRKSIEPFFKFENGLLKMTYLNPQREEVTVYAYNSQNILIAEAELGSDFSLTKAMDFSKERKGDYKIVLANGIDNHEYSLTIK